MNEPVVVETEQGSQEYYGRYITIEQGEQVVLVADNGPEARLLTERIVELMADGASVTWRGSTDSI